MGFFKIFLGPLGVGLPFRLTSKRERFQYDSVAAQHETNQLLERLIDSLEKTGTEAEKPQVSPPVTPVPRLVANHWQNGTAITAKVQSVFGGWRTLLVDESGFKFAIGTPIDFAGAALCTIPTGTDPLEKLTIDVSAFGKLRDLDKFLHQGDVVEFLVTVETNESWGLARMSLSRQEAGTVVSDAVSRAFDPKNRKTNANRTANNRVRYTLKLTKILSTQQEQVSRVSIGDVVEARLHSLEPLGPELLLPDGRLVHIPAREFPREYRVREGLGMHWLVRPGGKVWLEVLPARRLMPKEQLEFKPVPPPSNDSGN